ncbi:hypothetical protein [Membranihabitans maritimus]|uniref:hypothetical protein n=1 Tax=Membranihabitans maritimus TaxID=2904244 RepID=UPI001F3CD75F|nr:hypothetical protein [Membranihabitans maritimus]
MISRRSGIYDLYQIDNAKRGFSLSGGRTLLALPSALEKGLTPLNHTVTLPGSGIKLNDANLFRPPPGSLDMG